MPTNKVQTGVRFDQELLYKITYIAKQNRRSFNNQMEFLALEYVRQYEKEHGEIPINEEDLPV